MSIVGFDVTDEQREDAIRFLMTRAGRSVLKNVYAKHREDGPLWCLRIHSHLVDWIRQTLREGGFHWDPITFEDMGIGLLEEAAQRTFAKAEARRGA